MSLLGFFLAILKYLSIVNGDEWRLVWSDEFNGVAIDTTKWSFEIGDGCHNGIHLCGWGNHELQWYTNRTDNAFLQNGNLIIRVLNEAVNRNQYTSARMRTKHLGDWKYGKVQVRAKLPRGNGVWPAIWMLPTNNVYGEWPVSGEIDIMELRGSEPDKVHMTAHYGILWNNKSYKTVVHQLPKGTFDEDFHIFGIKWSPDRIDWMLDDETLLTLTPNDTKPFVYPFNEHFHLLLNVAVGGGFGGDVTGATFPQEMAVDYVRVFQKKQ